MNQVSFALPKTGNVTKVLMALLGLGGVAGGILWHWVSGGPTVLAWLIVTVGDVLTRPWTLVTAPFVPHPMEGNQWSYGFLFTMLFVYFIGSNLEQRWGASRFARFVVLSTAAGFLFSLLMDRILPGSSVDSVPDSGAFIAFAPGGVSQHAAGLRSLHPAVMFGSFGMTTALVVAWARENTGAQLRLFLFLPVSARVILWGTLVLCVLGVIYPFDDAGPLTPFGAYLAALGLSGSPSPLRALWLRLKLLVLRRRGATVPVDLEGPLKVKKRTGPPLRVVVGGQGEDVGKRNPPKDKRYLN